MYTRDNVVSIGVSKCKIQTILITLHQTIARQCGFDPLPTVTGFTSF